MDEEVTIEYYETDNGKCPFLDWQRKLTQKVRNIVTVRLARVRLGNFGDCRAVEGEKNLFELRTGVPRFVQTIFARFLILSELHFSHWCL